MNACARQHLQLWRLVPGSDVSPVLLLLLFLGLAACPQLWKEEEEEEAATAAAAAAEDDDEEEEEVS